MGTKTKLQDMLMMDQFGNTMQQLLKVYLFFFGFLLSKTFIPFYTRGFTQQGSGIVVAKSEHQCNACTKKANMTR